MADFQTVLDKMAQVIGGTQPDVINRPRWFSGREVGDGTGLVPGGSYPAFTGCYSTPPEAIEDVPVGVLLPGPFEVGGPLSRDVYVQGEEQNIDDLRVLILLNRVDSETTFTNLAPYRDLMPAAFAAKMTAFSTANALQAMVRGGKPVRVDWGGPNNVFDGWEFVLRVWRMVPRTYTG